MMNHVIRKQVMEISVTNQEEVHVLQQKLSEYNRRSCLAVLDAVMTELCPENTYILLDRLEINLGNISAAELDGKPATDRLYQLIKASLEEEIRHAGKYNSVQVISSSNRAADQWLFYMIHGYLDWSATNINDRWYESVIEGLAIDFVLVSKLCALVNNNPNALRRIVAQHDKIFLSRLVEVITASNQSHLPVALGEVENILHLLFRAEKKDIDINIQQFRSVLWAEVLRLASARESDNNTLALVKKLVMKFAPALSITSDLVVELEAIAVHTSPVLKTLIEELASRNKRVDRAQDTGVPGKKQQKVENREQPIVSKTKAQNPAQEGLPGHDPGPGPTMEESKVSEEEVSPRVLSLEKLRKEIGEQGVFTEHAGLVLLHPFLKYYFRHVGLTTEDRFTDQDKMERAVFLLHWLATGRTSGEEYEFFVPKLLIGWPIDEPLKKELELTSEETEEAVRMIDTVISEWSILKNTSIDGLREGFLQRAGKFWVQHDDYYLHIEKNGIDVLLGHLPWNLGVIKLPWLKELIRVNWV